MVVITRYSAWLAAFVVAAALPSPAVGQARAAPPGDTARFYAWWVRNASTDVGPGGDTVGVPLPPDVSRTAFPLSALRAPLAFAPLRPPAARGAAWTVGVLYQRGAAALVAWVPTDSTGFAGGASPPCAEQRTWIGVVPDGRWTALELTPSCDETYGRDEVDFALFWVGGEPWPHIEVTHNGPACVPATLYRYDRAARRYVLARKACAS